MHMIHSRWHKPKARKSKRSTQAKIARDARARKRTLQSNLVESQKQLGNIQNNTPSTFIKSEEMTDPTAGCSSNNITSESDNTINGVAHFYAAYVKSEPEISDPTESSFDTALDNIGNGDTNFCAIFIKSEEEISDQTARETKEMDENLCTLCNEPLQEGTDNINKVQKGLQNFITKSQSREDDKWKMWDGKTIVSFHEVCRKRYSSLSNKPPSSKRRELEQSTAHSASPSPAPSSARSETLTVFDFANLCFICGHLLYCTRKEVRTIKDSHVHDRVLEVSLKRNDDLGKAVLSRLQGISSLVDVKAPYHYKCIRAFWNIPSNDERAPKIDMEVEASFANVCSYIEGSGRFEFKLSELQDAMEKPVLGTKLLYGKLKEKYGDDILIAQHRGKHPTIHYKICNVSKICCDWILDKGSVDDDKKKTILHVASQILQDEILKKTYTNDSNLPSNNFLDNVTSDIPELLNYFLSDLLLREKTESDEENNVKRDSIAHSIVSILRPRTFISNLQQALGIYLYRKTGSRLIIDVLSKMGVCASYYSIQLYKASTIMNPPKLNIETAFLQFIFDKTDHNVRTLGGKDNFK